MQMEVSDYTLMRAGYRMKFNNESGLLRRQTYWIIDTVARGAGAKNGVNINAFNKSWPLDDEVIEDINAMLEERKKIGRAEAIKISNEVNLRELYKKIKSGRGNKGNIRSRR